MSGNRVGRYSTPIPVSIDSDTLYWTRINKLGNYLTKSQSEKLGFHDTETDTDAESILSFFPLPSIGKYDTIGYDFQNRYQPILNNKNYKI